MTSEGIVQQKVKQIIGLVIHDPFYSNRATLLGLFDTSSVG